MQQQLLLCRHDDAAVVRRVEYENLKGISEPLAAGLDRDPSRRDLRVEERPDLDALRVSRVERAAVGGQLDAEDLVVEHPQQTPAVRAVARPSVVLVRDADEGLDAPGCASNATAHVTLNRPAATVGVNPSAG